MKRVSVLLFVFSILLSFTLNSNPTSKIGNSNEITTFNEGNPPSQK